MVLVRKVALAASLAGGALLLAAASPPGGAVAPGQAPADCPRAVVEYALAANLRLADTTMGQGDGTYSIGPGRAVLRFDDRTGAVTMTTYSMREYFTVRAKALFWTTTVVTDTSTTTRPDARNVVADGRRVAAGRRVQWTTPLHGYGTDGTLTCDGSLCGKFGAPPPGRSELHIAPHDVRFASFDFAPDGKTFTLVSTQVSKTESPKQTAFLTLAGREVRRTCE